MHHALPLLHSLCFCRREPCHFHVDEASTLSSCKDYERLLWRLSSIAITTVPALLVLSLAICFVCATVWVTICRRPTHHNHPCLPQASFASAWCVLGCSLSNPHPSSVADYVQPISCHVINVVRERTVNSGSSIRLPLKFIDSILVLIFLNCEPSSTCIDGVHVQLFSFLCEIYM